MEFPSIFYLKLIIDKGKASFLSEKYQYVWRRWKFDATELAKAKLEELRVLQEKAQKEKACHDYFKYKWVWYPQKQMKDYKLCKMV